MMTLTDNGEDYEVVGYQLIQDGDYFVSIFGNILFVEEGEGSAGNERLVVKPIPVEHTFGKVVYTEGERRVPKVGEYYLASDQYLGYKNVPGFLKHTILNPVRFTDE